MPDLMLAEPVGALEVMPDIPLAQRDLVTIATWVASKMGSEHTRRAFRIEAQRWLAWVIAEKARHLHPTWLNMADSKSAAAYARFLTGEGQPLPHFALSAAGLNHQPFRKLPLASASVERAISVLKTMYADMVEMQVDDGVEITRNPFARVRTSLVVNKKSPRSKSLSSAERRYVDDALEAMGQTNDIHYHQCRWIWNALLWSALRRSELAAARVDHMYQEQDENGDMIWKMDVTGKGNVANTIPLIDRFMKEFRIYRDHHGLSLMPNFGDDGKPETTPLVLPIRGGMRKVSDEMIYREMKRLLTRAAACAIEAGNPASAARLRQFASHSARHTCVTMIVDATGDITLGQDMARHSSITTTRGYKAKSVSRLTKALKDLEAAN